ncbi:MAG: hypothetical protein V3V02_00125 [Rhizobiaceae bacterium]
MQASDQQVDDVKDAIDIASLIEAAVVIYPAVSEACGVASCAEDVIADIACDRHDNETVARFRQNPANFIKSGDMVDIGPISATSFAVLVTALESVMSAGHALDQLTGKRL